jgi:hypothetical protein
VTVNKWIYLGLESVEGDEVVYIQEERDGSGQGHSIVKFPVRKEGGRSAWLLIYTKTPM